MKSASIRWHSANAPSCVGMITASMVSIPEDEGLAGSGSPSGGTSPVNEICSSGSVAKGVVVACGVSGLSVRFGASGDWYSSTDCADLEGVLATACKDDKKTIMTCIGRLGRK